MIMYKTEAFQKKRHLEAMVRGSVKINATFTFSVVEVTSSAVGGFQRFARHLELGVGAGVSKETPHLPSLQTADCIMQSGVR